MDSSASNARTTHNLIGTYIVNKIYLLTGGICKIISQNYSHAFDQLLKKRCAMQLSHWGNHKNSRKEFWNIVFATGSLLPYLSHLVASERRTMPSNKAVAALTLFGASGVASVWMTWGYNLHCKTMARANAFERDLAMRVNWDHEKHPLHAFRKENMPQWASK